MGKKLYHGAAWYPELWKEEVLEEDLATDARSGSSSIWMAAAEA